jgi:hypothetical protein
MRERRGYGDLTVRKLSSDLYLRLKTNHVNVDMD